MYLNLLSMCPCSLLQPLANIEIEVSMLIRERERKKERVDMHCHGTACNRSFDVGSTSAEGHKLQCFTKKAIDIFTTTIEMKLTHSVVKLCSYLVSNQLSVCVYVVS